jgi:hypothetical protein
LPPEVTGLAAVPSTAEVIVGITLQPLFASPIVERAAAQLLAREPALAARWAELQRACAREVAQVQRVMLALGPSPADRPGTGPMLLIATGGISEPAVVKCAREVVGRGGGSVVVKTVAGRPLYHVRDGARAQFIAFGRADTVILGSSEAYVIDAVSAGPKALAQPELASWLAQADQRAPVWVVGRVADRLRTGLVRASNGSLREGARAFIGAADLSRGARVDLRALMASPEDAKQLELLVRGNLAALTWAAQARRLGALVNGLKVATEATQVRLSVELGMAEINQLLSMLDGEGPPAQDSPPAGGSSSAPAPRP